MRIFILGISISAISLSAVVVSSPVRADDDLALVQKHEVENQVLVDAFQKYTTDQKLMIANAWLNYIVQRSSVSELTTSEMNFLDSRLHVIKSLVAAMNATGVSDKDAQKILEAKALASQADAKLTDASLAKVKKPVVVAPMAALPDTNPNQTLK